MKTAIVYKSFLGTTQKYAHWLAESIKGSDLYRFNDIGKEKIKEYDVIVIMSGTYVGWMPLTSYVKKKWESLKSKKVIIVSVGLALPESDESLKSFNKIPEEIRKSISYFKITGKFIGGSDEKVKKENLQPIIEEIQSEK